VGGGGVGVGVGGGVGGDVGGDVGGVWVWEGRGGKQRYKHLTSAKTWHTGEGNNHVRGRKAHVCIKCVGGGSKVHMHIFGH